MYQVQDSSALVAGHRALLRPRAHGLRVPRTVVLLGFTSLLTDISSEMVAAVLPFAFGTCSTRGSSRSASPSRWRSTG